MGRMWAGVVSALLLAGAAAAQKMGVTGGVLQVGQTIQISYADPARAGQMITVRIDDGNPDHPAVSVAILLGATGQGSVQWTVLPWVGVCVNAPGVNQETRAVQCPNDDGSNW